eukprot:374453-Prorocentrum_lima.AAC.1
MPQESGEEEGKFLRAPACRAKVAAASVSVLCQHLLLPLPPLTPRVKKLACATTPPPPPPSPP